MAANAKALNDPSHVKAHASVTEGSDVVKEVRKGSDLV